MKDIKKAMVYLSFTLGRQDNMALTGTATTHTQVWLLRDLVPKFRALFSSTVPSEVDVSLILIGLKLSQLSSLVNYQCSYKHI
jgi:hypothetical protein